jgi:hypothetical protein
VADATLAPGCPRTPPVSIAGVDLSECHYCRECRRKHDSESRRIIDFSREGWLSEDLIIKRKKSKATPKTKEKQRWASQIAQAFARGWESLSRTETSFQVHIVERRSFSSLEPTSKSVHS